MEKNIRTLIPVPKIEEDCYDWYRRHEEKLAAVKKNPTAKIVFLGDSITHFWSGEESGPGYGSEVWREYFSKLPVLNLGYGFDRTQNVLWRIDHGELDGLHPELFIVNIGTNQFSITPNYSGDTPEETFEGIRSVAELLHSRFPDAVMVQMALFPRGGKHDEIFETNRLLHRFAETAPYLHLIDLTGSLGDSAGNPIPECYQPDSCHLAPPGYKIWAEALMPYLMRFLPRKPGCGDPIESIHC